MINRVRNEERQTFSRLGLEARQKESAESKKAAQDLIVKERLRNLETKGQKKTSLIQELVPEEESDDEDRSKSSQSSGADFYE